MNQYSRTRARETKPASGAVFQGTGVRKTKAPKGVTVEKRLQEFPAETFCKSAGVLFCRACTREVSLIKQTIVTHVKSEAHEEKKRTYIETRSEDEDVKALLSDYYMAHPDEAQATVLPDTLLFSAIASPRRSWSTASPSTSWTLCGPCSSAAVRP